MSESRLKIFSGNSNRPLAEEICASIGMPLGEATVTSFPDGESFVKINENVRGHDVYIIQTTCPPTNHHLMELLIMIDAARRAGVDDISELAYVHALKVSRIRTAERQTEPVFAAA